MNYLAWLLLPSVWLTTGILAVICTLVLGHAAVQILQRSFLLPCALFVGFLLLFFHPLTDWDARSIWFFHGKRMFYDGLISSRLDGYPVWDDHPDYPDLIPALGASIARAAGLWNELLPKVSLLLALLPPVLVLLARCERIGFRLFLFGVLLSLTGTRLFSGSMDAHLALYATAELVLLCEGFRRAGEATSLDSLTLQIVLLACMASLKQEGLIMAMLLSAPFACLLFRQKRDLSLLVSVLAFAVLVWSPILIWKAHLYVSDIGSDLLVGGGPSRLLARFASGEWRLIAVQLLHNTYVSLLLLLAWWIFGSVNKIAAGFLACYLLILFVVYLCTPHDLAWHLATSLSRVTLVFEIAISTLVILEMQRYFRGRPSP